MNGPPKRPGSQDEEAAWLPPAVNAIALVARQNRMIEELTRENALLRLRVETLTWALATVREKRGPGRPRKDQHSEVTTTPSYSVVTELPGSVTEGAEVEVSSPLPCATTFRVQEVDGVTIERLPPSTGHTYESKFERPSERAGQHGRRNYEVTCILCSRPFKPANGKQVCCLLPGCPTEKMSQNQRNAVIKQWRIRTGRW